MFPRLFAILLAGSLVGAAPAAPRPNIIILSDDMGYSDIGCYGGEIETPTLDGLAAKGLRYTRFYNTDAISDYAARYVREHKKDHADQPFFLYVAYAAAYWPMHALDKDIAKYKGYWKLVRLGYKRPWELYHIKNDRTELNDLSGEKPELAKELAELWEKEAKRTLIDPLPKGRKKR